MIRFPYYTKFEKVPQQQPSMGADLVGTSGHRVLMAGDPSENFKVAFSAA